ncbi:MAG: c-type cytochrome [Leptospiraceae bacterium]|nr:c-type cytochrome [Leptospiraceae bacterium]
MLSKSQARFFFLGGTLLFALVFLGLTWDTHRQTANRTNEAQLSESVVRGKAIWESSNCMGCHTILGEGAYYAPELTKVVERRGAEWIRMFIKDPAAMFPGERKMVQYNFNEDEITDIIAFLDWVGKIDTNGWPPKPNISTATLANANTQNSNKVDLAPVKYKSLCVACHAIGGQGGNVGPALDGVASRLDAAYLSKWLHDPQAVKPGTNMPKLSLSEAEIQELVQFLSELK